eukprot:TRINITY_DN8333_c0_g1_i1.p1 TRINITY_DN8333_c0_g1~~TRINITY_DN8333_c0_g1_i1.p1  ORF type:complete len:513 (-),score=159.72 TRINITY_DN8333_c0_g1_i1:294-1832(-)
MTNYYATVLHNFVPGSDRELALKAGEKVLLFNWDDPEWWYGDLNGKSGYFPSTHVELLSEEDDDVPPPPPPAEDDDVPPPPPPHAVALWDCNAETQHELSFRAGDHLLVLDDTNPDWLYVQLNNKQGYVPRNFVDYSGSSSAAAPPVAASASNRPKRPDTATLPRNAGKEDDKYVAIYDFPAQTLHQISLKAGEFVRVLEKNGEWWKGEVGNKTGLFPKAYVDVPSPEAFALIEKNNRDDVIVTPPPVPMGSGSFITQNPNVNRSNGNLNKLGNAATEPEPKTVSSKPATTIAATRTTTATSSSSSAAAASTSVSKAPAATTTATKTATTTTSAATKPAAATSSAPKSGKICKGCHQSINGAFMEVDEGIYHKSCFVCALCSSPLKKFFDKDDKIYCGDCFTNKVDVIPCGRCGKALGSSVVKACGKRFHDECFTCFNCKKPFNDNLVNNRDGQPWCDACVKQVVPKNNPTTRSTGPPKNTVAVTTGAGPKKTRTVPSKFQQQKMKYVSGFD